MMSGHTRCEQESKKAKWSQIGAVTWEEIAYPQASSAESRLVQTSPNVQIHQIGDVKPMFMSYRSSSYIGKTLSYSFSITLYYVNKNHLYDMRNTISNSVHLF